MPPPDSASGRLNSWKEIAAYLDRQVRSVQRWEKEEGLPVHRLPHKKLGSVNAFKHELDAWRDRRPELAPPLPAASLAVPDPPAPPRVPIRVTIAVGLSLLAAAGAGWWWHRPRALPPPAPPWGRLFARGTSQGAQPRLIPLGPRPDRVAITPDGATVAVGDAQDGTLTLVDTARERVRARLHLDAPPTFLAMASDSRFLYAGAASTRQLDRIDLASATRRVLPTPGPVDDAVLTPDGRYLYLAMQYAGLARLDTTTLALTQLTTPACPAVLALGPGGQRLYIAFQCGGLGGTRGHDAIGILDLASQRFVGRFVGPPQVGTAIAVSPNGAELWSSLGDACTAPQYDHRDCPPLPSQGVNVFSLGEGKLIRTLSTGPHQIVRKILFFPDGAHAAIDGGALGLMDTARLAILERLPSAAGVAFDPLRARAYVPLPDRRALAVFDSSPADCAPAPGNLLAWWPGDGSAADAWGLQPGTLAGGADFAPGRVGQAFSFNAPGSSISFGHDSHLASGAAFGLAAWLQLAPTLVATSIVAKMSPHGDNRNGWSLGQLPDGRLSLCVGGGDHDGCAADSRTTLTTSRPLLPGRWYHVAAGVSTDGTATIYLDGALAARGHLDLAHSQALAADLLLGAPSPRVRGLTGLVDELALYSAPPTAADRHSLLRMPACLGIPEQSPQGAATPRGRPGPAVNR